MKIGLLLSMNSNPCEFGWHPLPCNSLIEEIEM